MTFTFNPVVSTDNFTFVDGDGNTFSFSSGAGEQPLTFVQDSDGQQLTFVELSPNQTIGTVNNVINTYNQSGVDSDWILQRKIEEFSNVSDSDAINGYALVWDSDKQLYSPAPAGGGGGTVDSDFVQSVSIIENQLDGFTTTASAGVVQVEQAGGNGGYFNTSGTIPGPGTSETMVITLDSEWDAVNVVSTPYLTITGNNGVNTKAINLNGTYVRQPLSLTWVMISSDVFFKSTGVNQNYYWYNASNGVYIFRLQDTTSATTSTVWRFFNANMTLLADNTNVMSNLVQTYLIGTAGDFTAGSQRATGTIRPATGGGTSTYTDPGSSAKLTYTFTVPSIPKTFAVELDGALTVAQATTAIATAWDSDTPYTITTGTRTINIDTNIDSDLNNATVAVTNASASSNVTFGVRGTRLTVTNGSASSPGVPNTTKSIVSYRNVTYLVPLNYKDSEFFREFAQLENVDGVSFVYDSDNNKLIGTSDYTGFKLASALSVNHGGKDGTFAWDSDKATITTVGVSPGPSAISQQFFNTIYNENRVVQTLLDVGLLDQTTGTATPGTFDSDSVIKVRAQSVTTPTLADFGGSVLLGEY
jgi:hypothetical protein